MSADRNRDRREAARVRREAELATQRRRRAGVIAGVAVVVLALVVGIGIAVQSGRSDSASAGGATPRNLMSGGVLVGSPSAPVTVTTYEDFQCPVCKAFEQTTGPTLEQLRASGQVKQISKPVAILDRASSTTYSTRALEAAGCVIDSAPQAYPAFAAALFAQQPEEGGAGLPDATLQQVASQAGAPDIGACISDQRFRGWAARATDQASKDGLTGTPYVLVDGTPLKDTSPAGLTAAVTAAAGR